VFFGYWLLIKEAVMFSVSKSPYLVPYDASFSISDSDTSPPRNAPGKKKCKEKLENFVRELSELQRVLYAHNKYAVLLVFQALDAAGKDSTIRAVLTGVNPAGCRVTSFKKPSAQELEHDFLWRTVRCLPERGTIGVFNRSYYEEVLVVRVHPELLQHQNLPDMGESKQFWERRYRSIRDHEKHLAQNGTLILKFWLNISKEEQRQRFLSRINEPEKNWKFSPHDVKERGYWEQYMKAYEEVLNETSRPWAPWYAIPADDKPFMRLSVAEVIVENLRALELRYPAVEDEQRRCFAEMWRLLMNEGEAWRWPQSTTAQ
jgi:PPK2 family polyphosphate:nucleotide phosphotransferase